MMQANESKQDRKRKHRPDRLEYLDLLVVEFQETQSADNKHQVLANLVNFAYDAKNYGYFRQLNIIDLFLDHLSDADEVVSRFSLAGLCNLSLDPLNKEYILQNNGVLKISQFLSSSNESMVVNAITTLMFLVTPQSKPDITKLGILKPMLLLSESQNQRIRNVAQVFLQDYCTQAQVEQAQEALLTRNVQEIPLPMDK